MRSVTIDECTEGYLVKKGGTFKTYAVSKDKLIQKVKELFGITDKSKAVVLGGTKIARVQSKPELFINDSSDSTFSKYNIDLTINSTKPTVLNAQVATSDLLQVDHTNLTEPFVFTEIAAFEVSVPPITKGKSVYWLNPFGTKIKISREKYQSVFIYANISDLVYLHEHPTEAPAILKAYGKATYANKAVILRGFLKDVPLSALVGGTYNDDMIKATEDEPLGHEDGSCDDVAFESCANNTPEQCKYCIDQSRYEDKRKLAAKKPAPPLMKASVPP